MMTLKQFLKEPLSISTGTNWYIADISQAIGKQELFTKQSPQKLKALKEHSIIESAVSSNRIEGITIDKSRINEVIFGKALLKNRDEEEVQGYRDALNWIHNKSASIYLTEKNILNLHKTIRREIWDAGKYKEKDIDIIEKYPDGKERIRFKPVSFQKTPESIQKMLSLYEQILKEKTVHPLLLLTGLNLDFLCIHPFRDGNGRVSRLIFLLTCYHAGMEVGRFISLERLIEENKERYYETLEQSSQNWHKGKHNPWPFINFMLSILKSAYKEFENRVGNLKTPKGAKSEIIEQTIKKQISEFKITDIEKNCLGVSRELIRKVLSKMKKDKLVACEGKGPAARWSYKVSKGITS